MNAHQITRLIALCTLFTASTYTTRTSTSSGNRSSKKNSLHDDLRSRFAKRLPRFSRYPLSKVVKAELSGETVDTASNFTSPRTLFGNMRRYTMDMPSGTQETVPTRDEEDKDENPPRYSLYYFQGEDEEEDEEEEEEEYDGYDQSTSRAPTAVGTMVEYQPHDTGAPPPLDTSLASPGDSSSGGHEHFDAGPVVVIDPTRDPSYTARPGIPPHAAAVRCNNGEIVTDCSKCGYFFCQGSPDCGVDENRYCIPMTVPKPITCNRNIKRFSCHDCGFPLGQCGVDCAYDAADTLCKPLANVIAPMQRTVVCDEHDGTHFPTATMCGDAGRCFGECIVDDEGQCVLRSYYFTR